MVAFSVPSLLDRIFLLLLLLLLQLPLRLREQNTLYCPEGFLLCLVYFLFVGFSSCCFCFLFLLKGAWLGRHTDLPDLLEGIYHEMVMSFSFLWCACSSGGFEGVDVWGFVGAGFLMIVSVVRGL